MTRNETGKKKAKERKRMILAFSLIAVGLVMVITAAIMEASHYPWGVLLGTASQNAATIPDPSPIILDEEDKDVIITEEAPSEDVSAAVTGAAPESSASPSAGADLPGDEVDTANAPAVIKYVVIGTLKIPVLGVSQNLLEGSGKQMKYGVGHITGTAQPGQKGNCAVSGHRPYPFRYLDQLSTGDSIVIKSGGITYTYAVFDRFDVLPTEVWVLNNIPGEDYALTVITCTPYMVSSHRMIVRARLIDIDGKTPQDYYGEAQAAVTSPDVSPPEAIPSESPEPTGSDASESPSVEPAQTVSQPPVSPDATTDAPPG